MKRLAWLLLLPACGPAPEPEGPPPDELDALGAPVFSARVRERIAELEALVRAADEAREAADRAPEEGELASLVEMFQTSRGRMREVPLAETALMGDAALEELLAMNADEELSGDARNAALHLAFAIGTPAALDAVVSVLESASEPWRRRYAAWLLGQTDDDRYLLRMLLPLRYEKDPETVCWLAEALAKHGNYAGLEGLASVVEQGGDGAQLALAKQAELVASAVLGLSEVGELEALWASAEAHEKLDREPSDALRLEAWREVAELSQERFQLRGVDDARFVLCRTGPWGARLVAEALADEDPYIRLHAAQVLERMGGRARPVVGALQTLLRDPRTAHAVAEALGAVGDPSSLALLLAALRPHRAHELRVGAAHGLGKLADPAAAAELSRLVTDEAEPLDLRLAAAGALASCGEGRTAARFLARGMEDPLGDPQGCEVALGQWIASEAEAGSEGFDTILGSWRDLEGPPALLRTAEDTRARLAARAALVRDFLETPSGN